MFNGFCLIIIYKYIYIIYNIYKYNTSIYNAQHDELGKL